MAIRFNREARPRPICTAPSFQSNRSLCSPSEPSNIRDKIILIKVANKLTKHRLWAQVQNASSKRTNWRYESLTQNCAMSGTLDSTGRTRRPIPQRQKISNQEELTIRQWKNHNQLPKKTIKILNKGSSISIDLFKKISKINSKSLMKRLLCQILMKIKNNCILW